MFFARFKLGVMGIFALAGCVTVSQAHEPYFTAQNVAVTEQTPTATGKTTISGVRLTQGNAVDCPTIRDDAGGVHAISYISGAIAIGDRVLVTGFYAVTTSCVGTVLVAEQEVKLVR